MNLSATESGIGRQGANGYVDGTIPSVLTSNFNHMPIAIGQGTYVQAGVNGAGVFNFQVNVSSYNF
jgi:hypothetical protein